MANKTEKILTQIAQDPTKSRLIQIGVLIDDLKKQKKAFEEGAGKIFSMADLEKAGATDIIDTEISRLTKEQKDLKSGKIKVTDAPLVQPDVETNKSEESKPIVPEIKDVVFDKPVLEEKNEDAEKLLELNKLKEEEITAQTEAIKLGKEMGQSKESLLREGLDKDLINKIYDEEVVTPSVEKDKLNTILKQIMDFMKNERVEENKYEQERQKDLEEIKFNEENLAQLIELRKKLLSQEESGVESTPLKGASENVASEEDKLKDENKKNETERPYLEVDENASENIQNMQRIMIDFAANMKRIKEKEDELDDLQSSITKNFWNTIKSLLPYSKEGTLKKEIKILSLENSYLEEKFEEESAKEFPLAYATVEKIKDPLVKKYFTAQGLRIVKGIDRPYISLKAINPIYSRYTSPRIFNPFNINVYPNINPKNDYMVQLNVCGFSLRITNPSDLELDKYGNFNVDLDDSKVRYKIVDPDGKIVVDGIDYRNGTDIYYKKTWEYERRIKEEWDELNKK